MHPRTMGILICTTACGEINQQVHGCFMLQEQLWETPHSVYRNGSTRQETGKPPGTALRIPGE